MSILRAALDRFLYADAECPACNTASGWVIGNKIHAVRGTHTRHVGFAARCANCNTPAILAAKGARRPAWASSERKPTDDTSPTSALSRGPSHTAHGVEDMLPRSPIAADMDMRWPRG